MVQIGDVLGQRDVLLQQPQRPPGAGLLDAVRALDLPDRGGVAYVADEARAVAAVRRHLVDERGWSRRAVLTKPFWTPGRRGLD